jgi:ribosomal protein S28E/S33
MHKVPTGFVDSKKHHSVVCNMKGPMLKGDKLTLLESENETQWLY